MKFLRDEENNYAGFRWWIRWVFAKWCFKRWLIYEGMDKRINDTEKMLLYGNKVAISRILKSLRASGLSGEQATNSDEWRGYERAVNAFNRKLSRLEAKNI